MGGAGIALTGLERLENTLLKLGGARNDELLWELGGLIESQTVTRIIDEKTSPDGDAWPAWSQRHASTRHSNNSLLIGEGNLLDSIQSFVDHDSVEVGTNLDYAADHQYGCETRHIPQREFLGVSDDNLKELQREIDSWAYRLIRHSL